MKLSYDGAALVTGASSGLGAAFARQIAAQGMDLVLVARRVQRLNALAAELRERYGVQTWTIDQDLGTPDGAERVKAKLDALGIEVGLLVNCAGFGTCGKFQHADLATELRIVDVNCRAYVAMASLFLPPMVARGKGGIVCVSSTCAPRPVPNFATYGATKAFALSFGQALTADLHGTGVDVLTFVPGYIRTEFHAVAGMAVPPQGVLWNEPDATALAALQALGKQTMLIYRPTTYTRFDEVKAATRTMASQLYRRVVHATQAGLFGLTQLMFIDWPTYLTPALLLDL